MKTKHTPTPWYIGNTGEICACNHGHITTALGNLNPQGKANAAFIVKAVNCHDELVTCLKAIVSAFNNTEIHNIDEMTAARAILKKAGAP